MCYCNQLVWEAIQYFFICWQNNLNVVNKISNSLSRLSFRWLAANMRKKPCSKIITNFINAFWILTAHKFWSANNGKSPSLSLLKVSFYIFEYITAKGNKTSFWKFYVFCFFISAFSKGSFLHSKLQVCIEHSDLYNFDFNNKVNTAKKPVLP